MSGIVPKLDELNNKAKEVNDLSVQMFKVRNILFLSHAEYIDPSKNLNESKLHLNHHDTKVFTENFYKFFGKAKLTSTKESYFECICISRFVYCKS